MQRVLHSRVEILFLLFLVSLSPSISHAEVGLDYPELLVTPQASQRLEMEAKEERDRGWSNVMPLVIPATTTLLSGLYLASENPEKPLQNGVSPVKTASSTAIGVGATWLVVSYFLAANYTPYADGASDIRRLPSGTKQEKLTRERLAEESLGRPARLARQLNWLAIITNLGASAYVAGNGGTYSSIAGGVSALVAFTPLLFTYHWQDVNNQHWDYKKRIYGPVASTVLIPDAQGNVTPGVNIAWSF